MLPVPYAPDALNFLSADVRRLFGPSPPSSIFAAPTFRPMELATSILSLAGDVFAPAVTFPGARTGRDF
jgi:hypothetical protein